MRIVFTLILSQLFFLTAYAALPAAPDILYHPLRTDVTTGDDVASSDDVFVACAADQYDALEPEDQSSKPGKWKNYDESTNKYKKNCVACSTATFLAQYKKIITSGTWAKGQCCRESENVVCQEMLRAYKAGCTVTGASSNNDATAEASVPQSLASDGKTGYGKFASCIA